MTAHAKLSPSSSGRWMLCPASIRLVAEVLEKTPEIPSRPSVEGTYAHAFAELEVSRYFGLEDSYALSAKEEKILEEVREDTSRFTEDDIRDMFHHAEQYAHFVETRAMEHETWPSILVEQRLETSVEDCWGTSDIVLMSVDTIEIIDYKYGIGVPVNAEGNTQLRIYGIGALEEYGDVLGDTESVKMTVYQPRIDSNSTELLSAEDLRDWRETILRPAADRTREPEAPFNPSDEACRWCPAAGICRARFEQAIGEDFGPIDDPEPETPGDPETFSPEEVANLLGKVPSIKQWLNAFEKAALDLAYQQGVPIPGYKVIRSGGRRSVTDPEPAIEILTSKGYDYTDVARVQTQTIGRLEKLVGGSKELEELLGALIQKSEGRESLVPESARGAPISPHGEAAQDFSPKNSIKEN